MHQTFINSQAWMLFAQEPFAKGGKRAVYVHPENPDLCVKVNLPDQLLKDLWKSLPMIRRIRKSVSDMNENCNDWKILHGLAQRNDDRVWQHVPRCHGWADTDMGPGLVVDLIRDADGLISRSLLAYLWECGYDDAVENAVNELVMFWNFMKIPSRSLGLHNIAASRLDGGRLRLVVIDGFGGTQWLTLSFLQSRHARRRADGIRFDIRMLLDRKANNLDPGKYGFLLKRE
jgi:hypothetical protein